MDEADRRRVWVPCGHASRCTRCGVCLLHAYPNDCDGGHDFPKPTCTWYREGHWPPPPELPPPCPRYEPEEWPMSDDPWPEIVEELKAELRRIIHRFPHTRSLGPPPESLRALVEMYRDAPPPPRGAWATPSSRSQPTVIVCRSCAVVISESQDPTDRLAALADHYKASGCRAPWGEVPLVG